MKAKGSRARAKPGAKAKKAKAKPTDEERLGPCDLFCGESLVVLVPRQRGCEECYRDLEAMRRDAKAAGSKSQKWLKQSEKKGNEEQLHEFWSNWIRLVGPRTGKPRTGIFPMIQYVEFLEHRAGSRNEKVSEQLTRKQFVDLYEAKGMARSWGESEWARRLSDDSYIKSTDPEFGLLTMAATTHVQEIALTEYCKGRRIDMKSKEKKQAPGEAEQMVKDGFLEEGVVDMTSPSKNSKEKLLGLTSARETADESFWQNPVEVAADKEDREAGVQVDEDGNPVKKRKAIASTPDESQLDLDVIELRGKLHKSYKQSFDKLEQCHKTAAEEMQKSESSRGNFEDALQQFKRRTDCMHWLLTMKEEDMKQQINALSSGEDAGKTPLPIAQAMLPDLHTKKWFEESRPKYIYIYIYIYIHNLL